MITFNQYLMEEAKPIEEAGLIINKNDGAYPKDGQILIMAGGGGSGKSFILEKFGYISILRDYANLWEQFKNDSIGIDMLC